MKKVIQSPAFRIASSIVLLVLLSRLVNFEEVVRLIPTLNLWYALLVLGLVTLDRFMMSFKYNVLLKARGLHVPFVDVVKTYYTGNFVGFYLPATIGVDMVRVWQLGKHGYDMALVTSAIVIERLLGLVVLSIFSLVATFLFMGYIGVTGPQLILLNVIALVAVGGAFAVSISSRIRAMLAVRLRFLQRWSLAARLMKGYASYQEYSKHKGALFTFSLLTLAELALPILAVYFSGRALHAEVPFVFYVIVVPIFLFLARIPFAPSMIGVQEGIFVFLFSFAHVPASQAFAMGLLQHLLTMIGVTPGLIFYLQGSPPKVDGAVVESATTETEDPVPLVADRARAADDEG